MLHLPLKPWQGILGEVATAQTIVKIANHSNLPIVSTDVSQLLEQGSKKYELGDFRGAIEDWQTALTISHQQDNQDTTTIIIENLAIASQQMGKTEEAIAYWEEAISYYRQVHQWLNVGQILTQQAQAYNSLGQTKKAIVLAESALQIARTYHDHALEAAALGSRGEAYRLEGDYKQAIADLQSSVKLSQKIPNSADYAFALNKLAITYISLAQLNYNRADSAFEAGDDVESDILKKQALKYDLQSLEYFQSSLKFARQRGDKLSEINLLLNSIPPTYRLQKNQLATAKLQLALFLLKNLPNSQQKVYAAIKLAQFVQSLSSESTVSLAECPTSQKEFKALDLLNQAVSIAQDLQDERALSFALGYLGHVYECRQDYQQALNFTQQAQLAAKANLNAQDSLSLWEWQAGRILNAQNRLDEAVANYEQAVATFARIRSQIFIANSYLQLDYRDIIERIYHELIALKLILGEGEPNTSQNLNSVLTHLNALKLIELQNYFDKNSVVSKINQTKLNLVSPNKDTAVFWSIILEKRTAIIVCLPNGETKLKWIHLDSQCLKEEIRKFRIGLERRSDIIYHRRQAQKLYDWIIRPFTKDLESLQIKTLVFIPDGLLRSVPMAALHDSEQFLIQKYAIATTPSLSFIDPFTVKPKKLRALAVGITKDTIVDNRKYQALNNVEQEINQVLGIIPGSKQLLDENFTRDRLQAELRQATYPIIHIATHGEFSIVPEDTFLVTGNNDKLSITDLYNMLHKSINSVNSIDLLALTACETANGDDRTALGLASVALLAGVKSTLASLWSVNDAATVELVTKFYDYWYNHGVSKAEALQKAQQELISLGKKYAHPYYWAPFIMLGEWL